MKLDEIAINMACGIIIICAVTLLGTIFYLIATRGGLLWIFGIGVFLVIAYVIGKLFGPNG